jgi:hypothetical protein
MLTGGDSERLMKAVIGGLRKGSYDGIWGFRKAYFGLDSGIQKGSSGRDLGESKWLPSAWSLGLERLSEGRIMGFRKALNSMIGGLRNAS